jgi:hypothetical protein
MGRNSFLYVLIWWLCGQMVHRPTTNGVEGYIHGKDPSKITETDRDFMYSHLLQHLPAHLHKLESHNFRLNCSTNFVSSTHSSQKVAEEDYKKQIHEDDPFAFCDKDFHKLTEATVQSNISWNIFNGEKLLETLRNKRVAFVGDSLMRQFYLDFAAEMTPYESAHRYGYTEGGNSVKVSIVRIKSATLDTTDTENRYSIREYSKNGHNLTVLWCHDDNLQGLTVNQQNVQDNNPARHSLPCLQEAVHYNYIVLGVGLWYKPLHPPTTITNYFEDMESKYNKLMMSLLRHRGLIQRANPHAHILWQLIPHIGKLVEDESVHRVDKLSIKNYNTGKYWTHLSRGALWPVYYNQAIQSTARRFSDHIIDTYRLSYYYIQHFQDRDVAVHSDAVHYCPGSLFRGSLFLLQASILEGKMGVARLRHSSHRHSAANATSLNPIVLEGTESVGKF